MDHTGAKRIRGSGGLPTILSIRNATRWISTITLRLYMRAPESRPTPSNAMQPRNRGLTMSERKNATIKQECKKPRYSAWLKTSTLHRNSIGCQSITKHEQMSSYV